MIDISILGASGYGGNELVNILSKHPKVTISHAQSRSSIGKKVSDLYPGSAIDIIYSDPTLEELNKSDLVFVALPKDEAAQVVPKLHRVIDLSPSQRFNPAYVYGLPEKNRVVIKDSNKIANPGCYATASILGILPILKISGISSIAFDCKSGYSGGGRTKKYDFEENVIPYSLVGHYQAPEISKFVSFPFSFTPHVVNSFRGLISTIHVFGEFDPSDLFEYYAKAYKQEPFVKVTRDIPDFKTVVNTPNCVIGGFATGLGHAVIVSAIDNLLKGAASTAVQNMNLMFDFDESEGLK